MSTLVSIEGEREQGADVRDQNVMAALCLANIVKSSLGPQGLDKMLVDDIGDVTITNDGATILKQLEVKHPAAKVLVELAQLQDKEIGDGTTSVVIIAAELLKRANDLTKSKIHPTTIITGYKIALREAVDFIKKNLLVKVETLGKEGLINVAKTSFSSKIIGPEGSFFAEMIVEAMMKIKTADNKYPVKNVHIVKCHGQALHESKLINGYILEGARAAQGMPVILKGCKIACVDFNLSKAKMQMGVQILIEDPAELEKVRLKELDITKQRCKRILESGANLILAGKGIDDFALKYFVEKGCIAIRRVNKADMRKIAEASGSTIALSMADLEGDEKFDPAWLGAADLCHEERVGDFDYVFIEGFKNATVQTVLVRGANEYMTSEIERSLHDALCVVKRVLESNTVVAGGGAVEVALSVFLDNYARQLGTREQLAIAEFADALLVIPKILAVNATLDATDLVAKLRVLHNAAQTNPEEKKKGYDYAGLDLVLGKVRNSIKAGVIEPAISKIKSLKFATEAAIAILRIDDRITLRRKKEEKRMPPGA